MASRGLSLGRLPIVGLHDSVVFLALSTALFSIPFFRYLKKHRAFWSSVAVLSCVLTIIGLLEKKTDFPLPPVLKIIWFELHVTMAFFSYGLFGLGAIMGVLHLFPSYKDIEVFQYKSILIGYLFFSLSMIFGGIWAFLAWGTYWLWTPKELWSVLIWLVYTLYLHLRLRPWWRGKKIALVGIFGYIVVLFTYLGVSLLMKSSHSF